MGEVHLVIKNSGGGGRSIVAAYADDAKADAYQRAGSTPLEYVMSMPLLEKGETPTPSSSSTLAGSSGPATTG